jgi:hypothetical protein
MIFSCAGALLRILHLSLVLLPSITYRLDYDADDDGDTVDTPLTQPAYCSTRMVRQSKTSRQTYRCRLVVYHGGSPKYLKTYEFPDIKQKAT